MRRLPSTLGRAYRLRMRTRELVLLIAVVLASPGCSCGTGVNPRDRDGSTGGTDTNEVYPDGAVIPVDLVTVVPGTPADAATRFMDPDAPTSDGAPDLLYPLDGVLFPRNVWSPDVQWEDPGVAGDLYRVQFTGAPVTLTVYLVHTGTGFTWDHLVDYRAWRRLTNGAAGRDMQLTVDRWISASHTVVHGAPITVSISSAGIAGAVYYWTLGDFGGTEGRILRVLQGTEIAPSPENFMPTPPAGSGGERCAACHGLSRDGNHLAVALNDGEFGGVFDLTTDLTVADPTPVFRFDRPWFFAAFNPEGTRLVMTDPSQHTFLLDGATGAEITTLRDATHPAWSPDGAQVAMVTNADDAWNPTVGNLVTMAVTGDTFGAETSLHTGGALASRPEGGALDCYPTYSPDSRFIAFQHGTHTLLSAPNAHGALYLVPSGGGEPVRLDHASDGEAYYPNFTPFITEATEFTRVYWVLHYSPRDYGNTHVGTRGTGRRQIWVSAVSSDVGAVDPSAVPYWLPGQHTADENASAYWAPLPCRATGSACDQGDQCCSDVCEPNGPGPRECRPPVMCRHEGESCATSAECCEPSLDCVGGACVATGPI